VLEKLDVCLTGQGIFGYVRSFYQFYIQNLQSFDADFARDICRQSKGYVAKFHTEDSREAFHAVLLNHLLKDGTFFLLKSD